MARKCKRPTLSSPRYLTLFLLSSLLLSGCTLGPQAPDFLLLNSYFPSWLIGAIAATPVTVMVRYGLIRIGIDDFLPLRFWVYISFWLILALAFAYFFSPR